MTDLDEITARFSEWSRAGEELRAVLVEERRVRVDRIAEIDRALARVVICEAREPAVGESSTEPIESATVPRPGQGPGVHLRLAPATLAAVRRLASRDGVTVQSLIRKWVEIEIGKTVP